MISENSSEFLVKEVCSGTNVSSLIPSMGRNEMKKKLNIIAFWSLFAIFISKEGGINGWGWGERI